MYVFMYVCIAVYFFVVLFVGHMIYMRKIKLILYSYIHTYIHTYMHTQLVKGISASLRTLVIASFRAPATQFVMTLLRRLNPTFQMLRLG